MKYFKLGLTFSPQPPELKFADYLNEAALPSVPATFGHASLIPTKGWGMLGNADVGDCTIAGAMHCSMLWNAIAKKSVTFSTADALDDYETACGYVPGDSNTDTGGTMTGVAAYWQQTGMRDELVIRHKIAAYMEGSVSNLAYLDLAAYLFDAVGLGVELPRSAEQQFMEGVPWSVVDNDPIEGGHFIPYVQKTANNTRQVVTWGGLQGVEESWLTKYLREVVVYVSPEYLVNGKSPEGFDMSALLDDMEEIA